MKVEKIKGSGLAICLFIFFVAMIADSIEAHPFKVGERLIYKVKFMGFVVGKQILEVKDTVQVNGYPTYLFLSATKSVGLVSLFYRFNKRIESFADVKTLHSRRVIFYKDSERHETEVEVKLDEKLAIAKKKSINYTWSRKFSPPVLDAVSLTYWLRTQDLRIGEEFSVSLIEGSKIRELKVKVLGEEKVQTYTGSYSTFLCSEVTSTERKVWFSNDESRLPVKFQAETPMGVLTAYLAQIQDSLSSGSP